MILMSFDEILTYICDSFDSLITPKKIARSNTNIIYLMFKAISKGLEVINSVCVVLSNKFNPAKCSVEDLNSVASLVGTERLLGSASGLHILATNNGDSAVTLYAGVYEYAFDDDTKFVFELFEDTEIAVGGHETFIAMSENIGSYPVTAQAGIALTSLQPISPDIVFSCTNNSNLLGTAPETDLEFRKRILNRYDGQDSITELENQLHNLPYLFDCRVKFNNDVVDVTYGDVTIPPFTAVIFFSGSPRSEMADVIANKLICPTLQTENSIALEYESDVFVSGKQIFYINPFGNLDFNVEVLYKVDEQYISDSKARQQIEEGLNKRFIAEVHEDYVREDDIYNTIEALNIAGVTVLGVNLYVGEDKVDYINIPVSKIPHLNHVEFTREGN